MQVSPLSNRPGRSAWHLSPIRKKFNIFYGKGNSKRQSTRETRLLPIQYVVYETLVNGISSAVQQQDFKGAILIDYELNGEKYYIVFAMWYSKAEQIYFLTSLGQYSASDFCRGMQRFKMANEYRLKIKLAPIHREGLADLKEKLARSNLSGANVCLIADTITSPGTEWEGSTETSEIFYLNPNTLRRPKLARKPTALGLLPPPDRSADNLLTGT